MAENWIREELAKHINRNEKLVERIKEHGAKTDDMREIDFFFYAPEEHDANALADDLRTLGFMNVKVVDRSDNWSITAQKQATVVSITEPAFVEHLISIAAKRLADFDGWGTAV